MKKICTFLLAAAMLFSLGTVALADQSTRTVDIAYRQIKIVINDQPVVPQDANGKAVEPFILDGTTYLPVRAIAGALGLDVEWDGAASTVILTAGEAPNFGSGTAAASNGTCTVDITYRDIRISVLGEIITPTDANGKAVEPFILDGTTYLPVRAVAAALGAEVGWDAATSTVTLTTEPVETEPQYLLSRYSYTEIASDGGTVDSYAETYAYDAAGNLTSIKCAGSQNYAALYTYDAAGNMLSENVTGDTVYSGAYTYDAAGNMLTYDLHYVQYDGSDFAISTTYAYDKEGNLIKETTESVGNDFFTTSETVSTYDKDGNLLTSALTSSTRWAGDPEVYSSVSTTTCVYDKDGNLISRADSYDDFSSVTAYTYDKDGNLLSEKTIDGDTVYAVSYTYDKDGRLLTSAVGCSNAGSPGFSETFTYTYDKNGNLLKRTYTYTDSYGISDGYQAVYTYAADFVNYSLVTTYSDGSVITEAYEFTALI